MYGNYLVGREMCCESALGSGCGLVPHPDIGECPPDHYLMIASTAPEGVEVPGFDSLANQVLARWAAAGEGPRRTDVIRSNRVADLHQDPRILYRLYGRRFGFDALEERG